MSLACGQNASTTTAADVFLLLWFNRWVSIIISGQNMDVFRSLFRISCSVWAQRFGKTPHKQRWECGRGRRLCCPAITAFRSVTCRTLQYTFLLLFDIKSQDVCCTTVSCDIVSYLKSDWPISTLLGLLQPFHTTRHCVTSIPDASLNLSGHVHL